MNTLKEPGRQSAIQVATFYRFTPIDKVAELRARLQRFCDEAGLMGTVLLAHEGINSTICGTAESVSALFDWLGGYPGLKALEYRLSESTDMPFKRMKVKVRKEIVSFGQTDLDPANHTGKHVAPDEWDSLIRRGDVRVLDTRNHYEVDLGKFDGAEDPKTDTFRTFAEYVGEQLDPEKDEHVAMYCTGGIRCEKASAWMLQQGFKNIYQLKGGILNYIQNTPENKSSWQGECFVFDDRVTLDHQLQPTDRKLCTACRMPLTAGDIASKDYEAHISCPHCIDRLTPEREASLRERMKQRELDKRRAHQKVSVSKTPITKAAQ